MPIYEYRCCHCEQKEEIIQKANEIIPLLCSNCHTPGSLKKEISFGSFQLKGGGWYKDLYSSKKPEANNKQENSCSSSNNSCVKEKGPEVKAKQNMDPGLRRDE
jgi:putative FmdB family regulatory protein